MSHRIRLSLFLLVLLISLLVPSASVWSAPPDVTPQEAADFTNELASFASFLSGLDSIPELNLPIPMSDEGIADLLGLGQALNSLNSSLSALPNPTLSDVETALASSGLVEPGSIDWPADPDAIQLDFTLALSSAVTPEVAAALDINGFAQSFQGGSFPLNLAVSAPIKLGYNPAIAQANRQFYLREAPTFSLNVVADNVSISSFTNQFGFLDALVGGTVALDYGYSMPFLDPDGLAPLTKEEWTTTALFDLLQVNGMADPDPSIPAFQSTLTLNAAQFGLNGSVLLQDATGSLADGLELSPPDFSTLGDLTNFLNVSGDDVLAGLAQFAAGLEGMQYAGDLKLPFIQGYATDAFKVAQPFVNFVAAQGDADIVCGSEAGVPPLGSIVGLGNGESFYCQAYTADTATSVDWTGSGVTFSYSGNKNDTAGVSPPDYVTVNIVTDVAYDFQVSWTDSAGKAHSAVPRFETAAQLLTRLPELVGIAPSDVFTPLLSYDPATDILTLNVEYETDPGAASLPLDFGDKLREKTGLAGLKPDPAKSNSASVDPGPVSANVSFGVLLADGIPDTEIEKRFFLQNSSGKPLFAADLTANATVNLVGQVGFLEISAAGDGTDNGGTVFSLGRHDAGSPMLTAVLSPTVTYTEGGLNIPNAVSVTDLLGDLPAYVQADCNVDMSGGLAVTAEVSGVASASANFGIQWDDVFEPNGCVPNPDTLNVSGDADFQNFFAGFDPSGAIYGKHEGADSTTVLTDSSKNFSNERPLAGTLVHNRTDGSNCVIEAVAATTLTCSEPLSGGEDNTWQANDRYEVEGDPLALLGTILNSIDAVVGGIDNFTDGAATGALDAQLPIIGVSGGDLLGNIKDISSAIEDIRTATPDAIIYCGTNDANPLPTGNPYTAEAGSVVYCRATTVSGTPASNVNWSMNNATPMSGTTDPNTVGPSPSASATFSLTTPGGFTESLDFGVQLSFSDGDGDHNATLPATAQPQTLQALEAKLETELGMDPQRLTLEISDVNSDAVQDLVVKLDYGVCTNRPGGNLAINACGPQDKQIDPTTIPMSLDLASVPAMVSVEENKLYLEYAARANLHMAIPLQLATPTVQLLGSSKIELEAGAGSENLNLSAGVGPIAIKLGTAAVFEGTVDSFANISGTTVMTDTAVADSGAASFGDLGILNGDELYKVDNTGQVVDQCTITNVGTTTLTCDAELTFGAGDKYRIGGNGYARMGASFKVEYPAANDDDTLYSVTDFVAGLGQPGGVELAGIDKSCPDGSTAPACASLSMAFELAGAQSYLGELGFVLNAADLSNPEITPTTDMSRLTALISGQTLDWTLLWRALPGLIDYVAEGLDGAAQDIKVPVIGEALDGGAEIATKLNENVVKKLVAIDVVSFATNPANLETQLETTIDSELGLTAGTTEVTLTCGGGSCTGLTLLDVDDLRVEFSYSDTFADAAPKFDLGVPGVPLRASGALSATVGMNIDVGFGISRDIGPYLVAYPDPELSVVSNVGIGPNPGGAAACNQYYEYDPAADADPGDLAEANYSTDRCLIGVLSFLQVTLRDGDDKDQANAFNYDDRTALSLTAGLDFSVDSGDQIGLQQLTNGSADLDLTASADVNIDLRVRTGINAGDAGAFPSLLGTFNMAWSTSLTVGTSGFEWDNAGLTEFTFQHIHLDAGEFIGSFLAPITKQINDITSPFMPVIDTLRAPLPVLSDLSKLVGGPEYTLIKLLSDATGANLELIERILDLVAFANNISQMAAGYNGGPLWVSLGGLSGGAFDISTDALTSIPNPGEGGKLALPTDKISGANLKSGMATATSGISGGGSFETNFTRGGLSFPFLEQPTQIFGLIMGEDATLVRYDFGTMKATAGVSFTFRFAIGPVPMSVTLAGSATIEGRFAIGYDTYGIRQLIEGGNAGDLLDGLFIDDLDAQGNDVPEVRLVGTISARAAVDLVVVSAGVGGGIEMTFDLNLDDSPNPDGKLRMEEILNKLDNPWCLFEVSGKLEAFLEAFVKIDFFFFSKTWTFELARVTLLEFSAACEPPAPKLAHWDGNTLILNIGQYADQRNVLENKTDEEIVVREIVPYQRVSIAGFGIYQEYPVNANTLIWANALDDNDSISLEPGVMQDGTIVPFHLRAEIYGGADNDKIRTGEGNDTIDGGSGNDEINSGGGNDTVSGGSGNDALDGGFGNDKLEGESGDDRISGGPGNDRLYGNGGADTLTGGPGDPSGPTADGNDWLFGGGDNDTINGGWGNDVAFGGPDSAFFDDQEFSQASLASLVTDAAPTEETLAACPNSGSSVDIDIINGDGGNDILFGDNGRDEISGGGGDDLLCGNGGDDLLDGDDDDASEPDGNDDVYGGSGNDEITGRGGSDDLFGNSGHDDLSGGDGRDRLDGGSGIDILVGDLGTIAPHNDGDGNHLAHTSFTSQELRGMVTADETPANDTTLDCASVAGGDDRSDCLDGGSGVDYIWGERGRDTINGGSSGDYLYGNGDDDLMNGDSGGDTMRGGLGDDVMNGGTQNDLMHGDSGDDVMHGNEHVDTMRGGIGLDEMYGDDGDDDMWGDADDDTMEGNDGTDEMWGGAGNDDMIGGSSAPGSADVGDFMYGEVGYDVMIGDNGSIAAGGSVPYGGPGRTIMVYDLTNPNTSYYGNDVMEGNSENDAMYGGGANDTMNGNGGDDYMEGNGGTDEMYGDAGQDDMIGGSSKAASLDDWDTMNGNGNQDVMLGDNGTISRPGGSLVDGSVVRSVFLHDLDSADADIAGGDVMNGNLGPDDMYGGGEIDTMHGDDGDDYIEGNNDGDFIYGDAGQDDLIGGTEQDGGGHMDGADHIYGGDGAGGVSADDYDVILGDNARITRTALAGEWETNSFNASVKRTIRLFDVAEVGSCGPADTSGGDFLYGEDNYDVMYGQGGDDTMSGGGGDDYMEGNAGNDTMDGDGGNDDMVGGTGPINDDPADGVDGRCDGVDTMHGNDGFDVMAGDNAVIRRTLLDGNWQPNIYNGGIQHDRRILRDIDSPDASVVSGGDFMWGDAQDDLMYGQGGDDTMHGGDGDDFMEGNAADDTMNGNGDDDDMVGGTTAAALGDGVDTMHGNDGTDVMLGDNGQIERPLTGSTQWQIDPNTQAERRDVTLFDVLLSGDAVDPSLFGGDIMDGDAQSDQMFGQSGADTMRGGDDDDYMEGDHGSDNMWGGAGEDDMIGGGSSNTGVITAYRLGGGSVDGASLADIRGDELMDGGDTMYGDDQDALTADDGDVMAGDNARITRTSEGAEIWQTDPNAGGNIVRDIVLFDVIDYNDKLAADINGSDVMYGEGGRDLMFGQGDDEVDDDGDGLINEDPADGVDNDRDGREVAGDYFDCEDGRDNDGDGWIDTADPDSTCSTSIDEDGVGDEMHGGDGDDYMEGNHGSDLMYGDAGQDDMIGGNSAGDGHIGGGVVPYDLADRHDTMRGGTGDDNMTGDNAIVTRPVDGNGIWLRLDTFGWDMVVRDVVMSTEPERSGAFGNDYMLGNEDNDDMYGQMGDDYMEGNAGEDAMVGDLGRIDNSVEDGSREQIIETYAPFMIDTIYPQGSLYRQVELYSFERGDGADGDDIMLGNDGNDSMHGGAGNDIMNGNADEDHLFGGDDDDVMWGGTGHDHLWGGHHDDYLDVFPREAWFDANGKNDNGKGEWMPADPPEWFTYGAAGDNFEGYDVIYGGWDPDAMQANVGGPGPQDGDRLLDWVGAYNVYYVCPGAYGEGYITRMLNPDLFWYLETLAQADGAVDTATPGSSGFRETAIVYHEDAKYNAAPPHPENPGHFTCTGGVTP